MQYYLKALFDMTTIDHLRNNSQEVDFAFCRDYLEKHIENTSKKINEFLLKENFKNVDSRIEQLEFRINRKNNRISIIVPFTHVDKNESIDLYIIYVFDKAINGEGCGTLIECSRSSFDFTKIPSFMYHLDALRFDETLRKHLLKTFEIDERNVKIDSLLTI